MFPFLLLVLRLAAFVLLPYWTNDERSNILLPTDNPAPRDPTTRILRAQPSLLCGALPATARLRHGMVLFWATFRLLFMPDDHQCLAFPLQFCLALPSVPFILLCILGGHMTSTWRCLFMVLPIGCCYTPAMPICLTFPALHGYPTAC